MESHTELAVLGILACVIVYSLLTKAISRSVITLPMIFTAIGFLAASPISMAATPEILHGAKRILAELTLVLVLFADASNVKLAQLRTHIQLPLRLLIIGLPLTMAMGTAVVFGLNPAGGVAMALLTTALLTPTDAALGQVVVSSSLVPERLSQTINFESGLNDGLVLPFVLLGAVGAAVGFSSNQIETIGTMALYQLCVAPILGLAIGWGTAQLLNGARSRDLVEESAQGVVFLTTAFIAYLSAEAIGANGFIAAFLAGAVFGNSYRQETHFIREFMEGNGQLLTMAAFFIFGALLLPDGIEHLTPLALITAVLFLTIVRILPVWIALLGTGLPLREKLFLGWFGPRGLASILFTAVIVDEYEFMHESELVSCISMTVFLSIILHGLTAAPLVKQISKS